MNLTWFPVGGGEELFQMTETQESLPSLWDIPLGQKEPGDKILNCSY